MKIYASDKIDLDWFVGKDYWVLVRLDSYRFNSDYPMYVKVLRKQSFSADGTLDNIIDGYECKGISPDELRSGKIYDETKFRNFLNDNARCMFIESYEISLVEPLDFITTDDLVYELFGEEF